MKNESYVFGYGSLVNSESRNKTIKINKNNIIPAVINKNFGYVRTTKFPSMGIIKVKQHKKDINGLLFKIDNTELESFDRREKSYNRIIVPSKYISIIGNMYFDTSLPVYIYKPKVNFGIKSGKTCTQKYLKIVSNGFKEYGNTFHELYLKTTEFVKSKKTKRRKNNYVNNVNKKTKKKYT
uniref:Gamma-glutamylcyclotransferase AIG2-like domain-containing protein n=1 Tax=viral metagenome TaxID=1070528 RepID=A0A6C0BS37_9ZZZZ